MFEGVSGYLIRVALSEKREDAKGLELGKEDSDPACDRIIIYTYTLLQLLLSELIKRKKNGY